MPQKQAELIKAPIIESWRDNPRDGYYNQQGHIQKIQYNYSIKKYVDPDHMDKEYDEIPEGHHWAQYVTVVKHLAKAIAETNPQGVFDGTYEQFAKDGKQITIKGKYQNGLKQKKWEIFKEGKRTAEFNFENDEPLNGILYGDGSEERPKVEELDDVGCYAVLWKYLDTDSDITPQDPLNAEKAFLKKSDQLQYTG